MENSAAYQIGYFIWSVIAIIVILMQFNKMRDDPDRSRFASISLMLFWAGVIILQIAGYLNEKSPNPQLWLLGVGSLWFIIQVTSFVFAGIGMSQTFGPRSLRKSGRGTSIWAIVLGLMLFVPMSLAAYKGFTEARNSANPRAVHNPNATQQGDGMKFTFEEYNFAITLPGKGWVELDKSKINDELVLVAINRKQRAFVNIVAESVGDLEIDPTAMEEVIRGNLKSVVPGAMFSDFYDKEVGGWPVRTMEATTTINNKKLEYQFHVFKQNGVYYQVIIYFSEGHKDPELIEKVMSNFEILDEDLVLGMDETLVKEELSVPALGLSAELTEGNWLIWDDMKVNYYIAEDGAMLGHQAALIMFGSWEISTDEDPKAFENAILRLLDVEQEEQADLVSQPSEIDGHPATEFLYTEDFDGEIYHNRVRVALVDSIGVAIAGWWTQDTEPEGMLTAMDNVRFNPDEAVKPTTYSEDQSLSQAQLLNGIGLYHYTRSRYIKAMPLFQRASELNPKDTDYFENIIVAASDAEAYDEGIAITSPRLKDYEDNPGILAEYALLLSAAGQNKEAIEILGKLFRDGYTDDDTLLSCINIMIDEDDYDGASELLNDVIALNPRIKLKSWLITVYRLGDNLDKAESLINELSSKEQENTLIREERAKIYLAQELPSEARQVTETWLEAYPKSVDAALVKIEAEMDLRWYADAKKTVSKALEKSPGDSELLEYRSWIESEVGEDNLSLIRNPITPVEVPEAVQKIMDASAKEEIPEKWTQKGAVYKYIIKSYDFEIGERLRQTNRSLVKLQTRRAVENFSTLEFNFDRSGENIYINEIKVFDAEGKPGPVVNRDSFYIAEQSDGEMATDTMTLYVPVSGLAPGYSIEWSISYENFGTSEGFPFKRHYFAISYPTLTRVSYILGDINKVAFNLKGVDLLELDQENLKAWKQSDIEAIKWEEGMPDFAKVAPYLELGPAGEDWKTIITEYLDDIQPYLKPDEKIAAIVEKEKLSEMSTPEKVYHLAHLAQDQVVYKALEFGSRGRIPETASDTWENRYGDCKDQTILLHQLLKAVDVDSHPLLISTSQPLAENIPSLDQFNHMVLYIPELANQPVIDLVDQQLDFSYGPPKGLADRTGIICDPENPRPYTINSYPFSGSIPAVDVSCKVDLDESANTIKVVEKLTLTGYYASFLKSNLSRVEPDRQHADIEDRLRSYFPLDTKLSTISVENLEDAQKPLIIEAKYSFPISEEPVTFAPAWTKYYLDIAPISGRQQPYELTYPFSVKSIVAYDSQKISLKQKDSIELSPGSKVAFKESTEPTQGNTDTNREIIVNTSWPSLEMNVQEYYTFYRDVASALRASERLLKRLD